MIKLAETKEQKDNCYELICLQIKEEQKYNSDLSIPNKKNIIKNMNTSDAIFLIDIEENEIVGYISAYIFNILNEIQINGLYVKENYRRQKIGTNLLNAVLKIASDKNIDRIKLYTYSQNESLIKFYENFGFEEIKKEFSYTLK